MYTLNELLKKVVDIDCSDLHLSVGTPPRVRKNGQLTLKIRSSIFNKRGAN